MSASATIPVVSTAPGNFQVAHGLDAVPTSVIIVMTSPGAIWLNGAQPPDAIYVYLVASDAGVTANVIVSAGAALSGGSGYTTITAVAASFPTFVRNGPKGPSDSLIQQYINDEGAEIDAILQRRFQEAFQTVGFTAWQNGFTADQLNLLEKINRYGACGEMAKVFAAMGVDLFRKMAEEYETQSKVYLHRLNGCDDAGKPRAQGAMYDYLFDSQAKVETPRPQLGGVAGGDQQPGMNDSEGVSNVFKKWDRSEF
jgi:hypothetical protein